jgi:hypothetical protein
MIVEHKLINVATAAKYIGRSEKAIRRMYESGKITPIRIDGRVQFSIEELDAIIEKARKESY